MKNQKQYRQGDVLIERIASLPQNLKPVARENGRVILAHGEVTGRAHAFTERTTNKFTDESGAEFFEVTGPEIVANLPILRRWRSQVLVNHPEFGAIEFAESDITIHGERAIISGEFGLLKHDEHNTHGVPAGFYRGAGADKTVHQREYSPQGIRRSTD